MNVEEIYKNLPRCGDLKEGTIKSYYQNILLWTALFSPFFSLMLGGSKTGDRFMRVVLLPMCVLALFFLSSNEIKARFQRSLNFLKPFLPWFVVILFLSIVKGEFGGQILKLYFFPFAIVTLLFVCLPEIALTRRQVVSCFAFSNIFLFVQFFTVYLKVGGPGNVNLINQNLYISGVVLFTVMSFAELIEQITSKTVEGKKSNIHMFLLVTSMVCGCMAISFLQVRTALFSLSVAFFSIFLFNRRLPKWVFVLVAVLIGSCIYWFFVTGRINRGVVDLEEYLNGNTHSSWGMRLEMWRAAFNGFLSQPFIGWGIQPLEKIAAFGAFVSRLPESWPLTSHCHNDMFHILACFGLTGFFSWVATQWMLFKQATKDVTRVAVLVAFIVAGFSECWWSNGHVAIYIFYVSWFFLSITEKHNIA